MSEHKKQDSHISEHRKPDSSHPGKRILLRQELFRMVSIGVVDDTLSRSYDIFGSVVLVLNLVVSCMLTFDGLTARYGGILFAIEGITVFCFLVDYILRLMTARLLYPQMPEGQAVLRFVFSFSGIIDLLSFLPYYLPVFFPAGAAAFRMLRVARIFRMFQINAYYDSLNVITEVIRSKRQQLLSSVYIILVLMLASSLCMYSIEHEAQPEVFSNAFSGIWWSASTLLTVGYGDIYPVTTLGKFFGILIAFLGVGMVAIPTGIISAGFVEQYTKFKQVGDYGSEESLRFISVLLKRNDRWCGMQIRELGLPSGTLIAAIRRRGEILVPKGDVILCPDDTLVLAASSAGKNTVPLELRELVLAKKHPWNGQKIRHLDISRKTLIVMIRRNGTMLVPHGDLELHEGDVLYLYSEHRPDHDQ